MSEREKLDCWRCGGRGKVSSATPTTGSTPASTAAPSARGVVSTPTVLTPPTQGGKTVSEEWRRVEGWPYEVSDKGRVRRADDPDNNSYRGRIISQCPQYDGYLRVSMYDGDRYQRRFVSRLVAEAFVERPSRDGSLQVNHKNGDKKDNRADNLEWVTPKENHRHASRKGLRAKGERHGQSKLTESDVVTIRRRYSEGATQSEIAADYGVCRGTISSVVRGKTWRHAGGPLK